MRTVQESGVRVLLTGQGADEYLGGYQYFESYALADLIAQRRIANVLSHLLAERNAPRLPKVVAQIVFLFLPAALQELLWRKPWLKSGRDHQARCAYEEDLVGCHSLREALLFHVKRRLPELLRYEDRNSMAFSIETRHPFLDHDLVEFVLDSPPDLIVGANVRKNILRRAVQADLPQSVLGRRDKIGFDVPETWLRSEAFLKAFKDLCSRIPPALADMVDVRRAYKLLKRRSGRGRRDLWRIYSVLLWHEQTVRPDTRDKRVDSDGSGSLGVSKATMVSMKETEQ
jgi:asparagine synthase (glutamine-hydrolysing)